MAKKIPGIQLVRRMTLGFMLVGMTTLAVLHQKMQGIPSIDALDPFGGFETLMKFLAGGEFIKKIEPGTVVLFGGIVVLAFILSRFFCGWFCAFGALQGVFGWIGKTAFGRRFTVPAKLDRVLRFLKYPILVAIVTLTWYTGQLIIRPYDPLAAYGHLAAGPAALIAEFAVGTIILILVMLLSIFYERVFCKYLCPLGALNAILGRVPFFRIRRDESTCVSCSKCDHVCPMNVAVSNSGTIDSSECIACMECVTACPTKKNTLRTVLGGKAVKAGTIIIIGFAIFAGTAAIGQAAGMLRFVAPSLQSLATKGSLDVADIKGSSTYADVAEAFGIGLDRLYREVGIDRKTVPPGTMLKDTGPLAGIDGFEADAVRLAVAKILGLPYAGESGKSAPTVASPPAPAEPAAAGASAETVPAAVSGIAVPDDFELEGTMSIDDVSRAIGASAASVIEKLGLSADISRDTPLRDMKDQYGYSMPALKKKIRE